VLGCGSQALDTLFSTTNVLGPIASSRVWFCRRHSSSFRWPSLGLLLLRRGCPHPAWLITGRRFLGWISGEHWEVLADSSLEMFLLSRRCAVESDYESEPYFFRGTLHTSWCSLYEPGHIVHDRAAFVGLDNPIGAVSSHPDNWDKAYFFVEHFFILNFRGGLAKCILVDGSNKIVDQYLILLDSGL
jgi:hypothetical protein